MRSFAALALALSLTPACADSPGNIAQDPSRLAPAAPAPVQAPQPSPAQPGAEADPSAPATPVAPSTPAAPGAPSTPAPPPQKGAEGSKPTPAPAPAQAKTSDKDKQAPKNQAQAFIVYTGDLALSVDAEAMPLTIDRIIDAAETEGGHLAGRTNDSVKVKIPSANFREGMQKIAKLGDVLSSNVNADDVTAEFHDLEVRLENLKATRKRLEEFLAKSGTIADMLTVERELERVAKEMDTIVGRLRFLREHTAFSLLTVKLAAKPKPAAPQVAEPPPPPPPPAPPPPPRAIDLPVSWFGTLGIEHLLTMPVKK